jgi:hypothetical protein
MRKAILRSLPALLLCAMLILSACSTAWIGEAEQIVAVLVPAATNIVALAAALQGNSVSPADFQMIQNAGSQAGADLQLIQSLITAYQKADASAQPGVLNQIQVAVSTAQSTLNALLPALHIKDAATQAKISAVVGIVISEVDSLAAILPIVSSSTSPRMMFAAATQSRTRPPLTANQFAASYNSTMTAKTGQAQLDTVTSGLQVHAHPKAERWASAGFLK